MIIILADDFTGAAEIAGIALRYHLAAELHTTIQPEFDMDVLVIDTDTRSCPLLKRRSGRVFRLKARFLRTRSFPRQRAADTTDVWPCITIRDIFPSN